MTANSAEDIAAASKRWANFFETMTPGSLDGLGGYCRPDIRFKDPFNDVRGVDGVRRVFEHMFATVDAPVFTVTDIAISGQTAYLRWDFTFQPKGRTDKSWAVTGLSEVVFDEDHKIVSHIDHWDAGEQFYARLPVLGWLIRLVRSKLRAG